MAPITTASNEETHAALLDQLDMFKITKRFRNPNWRPPQRRNKNLKQILSEASRREASLQATQSNSGITSPSESDAPSPISPNPAVASRDLQRAVLEKAALSSSYPAPASLQPAYSWTGIAAAPSFKPKRRYCDITGLPAPYADPKTGLRYANKEVYAVVKTLGTGSVQEYLAARGANTVLK